VPNNLVREPTPYRDSLRLFFGHLATQCRRSVADLRLDDITADRVVDFLEHLEVDRHNLPSTRNGRLAALRSFARHVIRNDPTRAEQYQRLLSLPFKKTGRPVVSYVEPDEMRLVLEQVNRRSRHGPRDYALLLFLYNSGARVSEALHVRCADLQLQRPFHVRLYGKNRKDRICPLWPETAGALRPLVTKVVDGPVFRNARGEPLTRDGVALVLDKYVEKAAGSSPSLRKKRITPHTLRHGCAVGLLQAGVDLTVIRDILGHESIATTGRYAKANLEIKRRVLKAFWEHSRLLRTRTPSWQPTPTVLAFLDSL